jgi:hypothetical protein
MVFILSFFFFLLQNWRIGGWNRSCLGGLYQWEGGSGGERVRRLNDGQKCEHMYRNGNITPVETIPGIMEGGTKESSGGEFKYDIFDTL